MADTTGGSEKGTTGAIKKINKTPAAQHHHETWQGPLKTRARVPLTAPFFCTRLREPLPRLTAASGLLASYGFRHVRTRRGYLAKTQRRIAAPL